MQDFDFLDNEYNFAGLSLIEFLPTSYVEEIPDAVNLMVEDEITLTGINRFYRMYATLETMRLSYSQQFTEHGPMYDVVVQGFIPKLKIENDYNFEQLKDQQMVVICNDENGNRRIIGSVLVGAIFSIDADTAAQYANRNGTAVRFNWQSDHIPYYYDIELPAGGAEDIIEGEE